MAADLRLLSVHAHPDDEASKGASTVAKYVADGAEATLVTCTGGEEGEILNPKVEHPGSAEALFEMRMAELRAAVDIIGYQHLVLMGYRDSGMPDSEANQNPACFARADLDEAIGRLVAVIRERRPQVIVTYGDDQQGYPHPDHLRVHDISMPAFELAADPTAYPELGEPWQPLKLYYSTWSLARIRAMHEKFLELGLESPFDEKWFSRPNQDERITTRIDIAGFADVRSDALRAHATQIDPESPFWFGLPPEVQREVHPWEDYILARSLVDTDLPEDDLFAGVRERVDA